MNRKAKVLLIDDETMFTRLLRINLERTGQYEVREENDGSKGYAATLEFRPDVILLDVMMRECPGPEVARQIRADHQLRGIPIIFVTATPIDGVPGRDEACDIPYITKPAPIAQIVRSIDRTCGLGAKGAEGEAA
ncbi:MAG: Transcriptional regulatory protein WalR [Candidatus Omnitrophica bacterium]|nr:Transcriptional regulatory protein WalR [Candidatus Omnitrophota bacterium]